MKRLLLIALGVLSASSVLPMVGCSREVAHSERDKPNFFGGRTHEETSVYKNPDGSYSTEETRTKTR